MKMLISILSFIFLVQVTINSQVTDAEYFIDNDPGFGMATNIPVSMSESISLNFDVDLEELSTGPHVLHVRVKDAQEKWSLFARKLFYVIPVQLNSEVVAAEYFIGDDPGFGAGSSIAVTADEEIIQDIAVSTVDLPEGINILHSRVRNAAGRWSLSARRPFYVLPFSVDEQVVEAEYFIGTDPGTGNGLPFNINSGAETSAALAINTGELSAGMQKLNVRVMDDQDKWSLYASRSFYVIPAFGDFDVTQAEYFVDIDPGVGMATAADVPSGQILNETLLLPLADTLMEGTHFLHLRVRNSNGKWSLYALKEFEIDNSIGVDELSRSLKTWPNPTRGELFFSSTGEPVIRYRVIDMKGDLLRDESFFDHGAIDLSELPSGTYLVQFFTQSTSFSSRVLKQ